MRDALGDHVVHCDGCVGFDTEQVPLWSTGKHNLSEWYGFPPAEAVAKKVTSPAASVGVTHVQLKVLVPKAE